MISRRFGMPMARLGNGGQGTRVILPHRVIVCLYEGVASAPLGSVNTLLNNGSRTSVDRNMHGVRGSLGASRTLGGAIGVVGGGVGPMWKEWLCGV